ncbi:testis-expressed protein 22 [Sorex fumeus]|uniref:testis-expressed protein 22 n=1 Tax=Sorex fumeus TaxID=62283 RepID=UPI0024ACDAA9|nr:testis-expressed protein 22 [Sorex fumeus]
MRPPSRVPGGGGARGRAAGEVGARGGGCPRGLQTQDWVCEPPQSGQRRCQWSMDLEERRQLVLGSPSPDRRILQTVASLLSEGVDKDVLLPRPPWLALPAEGSRSDVGPGLSPWRREGPSGSPRV